jgi:DNA-directed RNA polymerase specialized sigma24 family protein
LACVKRAFLGFWAYYQHLPGGFVDSEQHLTAHAEARSARHVESPAVTGKFLRLPVRERSLLALVYRRGATQREIAGALGISRTALRVMLRRAERKARDPTQAALVRTWRRLTARERRLAYLHLVLGLSLGEIARRRLAAGSGDGRKTSGESKNTLARRVREILRKIGRAEARRSRREKPCPHETSGAG